MAGVPICRVKARWQRTINKGGHSLSNDVENLQFDLRSPGQSKSNLCRRIERVGVVLRENKTLRDHRLELEIVDIGRQPGIAAICSHIGHL